MKKACFVLGLLMLALWLFSGAAHAQEPGYTLRLRRDWGTGLGSRIQGRFTLSLSGDEAAVQAVIYLLDGQQMARVDQPPFRFSFDTGSYPPGEHRLSAELDLRNGQSTTTPELHIIFMGAEEGRNAVIGILLPILGISLVVGLVSVLIQAAATRKAAQSGDPADLPRPSICQNCGKPFSRPLLGGFNLGVGKLMPCPHCRKWQIARPASRDDLQAALARLAPAKLGVKPLDEAAARKDAIDDSKYIDGV